jgi:putative PIN family toxin of toxin-antitoxin system
MMKKVVLDTNVIVSGLVYGGVPWDILDSVSMKQILAVISPAITEELMRILKNRFGYSDGLLSRLQHNISEEFEIVVPTKSLHVLNDEPDNRVLEAAMEGRCEFIITGDKKFLVLEKYQGIAILSPRQFYDFHYRYIQP